MSATDPCQTPSGEPDLLDGYRPRGVDGVHWAEVRPLVAEALVPVDDEALAKRARYPLTRMALHLRELGHEPTVQLLFNEPMIANWTATLRSDNSAATHRSTLRAVARAHSPRHRRPTPISQPDPVVDRFSDQQVAQLLAHADAMPTLATRLCTGALVLAGVGAGLDGYDLINLPATAVRRHGDLVVVEVTGSSRRDRAVGVLHEWGEALLEVAQAQQQRSPGCVLLGGQGSPNVVNRVAAYFKDWGGPRVNAQALRSTWLATHIRAGTPMPVLFDQAGVLSATAHIEALIVELAAEMERDERLAIAAGAGSC